MDYNLKIVGGTIIDGSGGEGYRGDVGIKNGSIVALGKAEGSAARTVDAGGLFELGGDIEKGLAQEKDAEGTGKARQ